MRTRRLAIATSIVSVLAAVTSFAVTENSGASDLASVAGFTATPSPVGQFGGPVLFTATVANAATCQLIVSPVVAGLPATTPCTGSSYARTVSLPANLTTTTKLFHFTLKVTGANIVTTSINVNERPVNAAVTATPVSTTTLFPSMGVPGPISCPAVGTCFVGDAAGNVINTATQAASQVFVNPVAALSCVTSTWCVATDTGGNASLFNGTTWSPAQLVNAAPVSLLSCAAIDFCEGADGTGNVLSFNGTTWSAPALLDTIANPTGLSCATTSMCVLIDESGAVFTYGGASWSHHGSAPSFAVNGVSCPSTTYCVAIDAQGAYDTYNGSTWTGPVTAEIAATAPSLTSVSCSSTSFCVAIDSAGNAVTIGASKVSLGAGASTTLTSISCAADGACAAVSAEGRFFTLASGTWSSSSLDPPSQVTSAVACTSRTFCLAVGSLGSASVFNGIKWSVPVSTGALNLDVVSCAGTFCMAAGDHGQIVTYKAGAWGPVKKLGTSNDAITALTCLAANFCAAGNLTGSISFFNGASWSTPKKVDVATGRGIGAVACGNHTYCVFSDHAGYLIAWSAGVVTTKDVDVIGGDILSIACPVAGTCVAVDRAGYQTTVTYHSSGSTFATPVNVDHFGGLESISCPTSFYCAAVDSTGRLVSRVQSAWSVPAVLARTNLLVSVSCESDGYCAAVNDNGQVFSFVVR